MSGARQLMGIDLTDPTTHADRDLRSLWSELRREEPVAWHPRGGFWVVSRYDDARTIYTDRERFTSRRGNALDSLLAGGDPAAGKMLSLSDGPRHVALRSGLLKGLSASLMARIKAQLERNVRVRLDAIVDREVELVDTFARHIPLDCISELLGIDDPGDRETLCALAGSALSGTRRDHTARDSSIARNEILLKLTEVVERRRLAQGDDLVSVLIRLEEAGQLTAEEVVYNCYSLFLGGNEEPRFAIAGSIDALANHPDEWRELKRGSVDIKSAVEELLRWTTPVLHLARTVAEDATLGGVSMRNGEIVSLWNVSANFDESAFDQPDRLRLGRGDQRHLAFGFGNHFCLGASLARMALAAVVEALVERVDHLETRKGELVYSNFIRGYASLPGRLSRRLHRSVRPRLSEELLLEEQGPVTVVSPAPGVEPFGWLRSHASALDRLLSVDGCIVLRGLTVRSLTEFSKVVEVLAPSRQNYINRSTPRTHLGGRIYTATEYPQDRHIPLHNENSYTSEWPTRLLFYGAVPATKGGETLIADGRRVCAHISREIRETFEERGVLYVRNFTPGVDLSWQEVFQTERREDVDAFCHARGIELVWRDDAPVLTTRSKGPATLRHSNGELVWFNQAHLFHASALAPNEQSVLAGQLGGQLPRNAFYGNGEPIEPDVLAHIREAYDRETFAFPWLKGDVMVLDNVLFAHGRNPFSGPRKLAVAMG